MKRGKPRCGKAGLCCPKVVPAEKDEKHKLKRARRAVLIEERTDCVRFVDGAHQDKQPRDNRDGDTRDLDNNRCNDVPERRRFAAERGKKGGGAADGKHPIDDKEQTTDNDKRDRAAK